MPRTASAAGTRRDRGRQEEVRQEGTATPAERIAAATRASDRVARAPAFVHVSLGRKAGVRPGDLVGAIANETGLVGREIGPIRISEAFSVVGVPEASVDHVIETMQSTTMRGKRARVRRFVE